MYSMAILGCPTYLTVHRFFLNVPELPTFLAFSEYFMTVFEIFSGLKKVSAIERS
jgi:hypothetical protein